MDNRIRKAFEECNKFIDEHTSKELKEYEKSLNLDYDSYYGRKFTEEENNLYNEMLEKLSIETNLNILDLFDNEML